MSKGIKRDCLDIDLLTDCFNSSMNDVMGTMAGFTVHQVKENTLGEDGYQAYLSGVMLLQGSSTALLRISLSEEAAATIVAYMTGIMPDELQEGDLYDGTAELVNLLAGRAKALLAETPYHFTLSPPFTVVGQNHFFVHKKRVPKFSILYSATNMEMLLEVYYI